MMKNIAIAAGLMFVCSTGLAFAGDKTETKTEETTAATSADGAVKTKKTKKHKKAMDGSTSTETKTETTK